MPLSQSGDQPFHGTSQRAGIALRNVPVQEHAPSATRNLGPEIQRIPRLLLQLYILGPETRLEQVSACSEFDAPKGAVLRAVETRVLYLSPRPCPGLVVLGCLPTCLLSELQGPPVQIVMGVMPCLCQCSEGGGSSPSSLPSPLATHFIHLLLICEMGIMILPFVSLAYVDCKRFGQGLSVVVGLYVA